MTTLAAHQIVADIADGGLDSDLEALKSAIDRRLSARRATLTIRDYSIGTKVRFNNRTGTRYMVGQTGVISSIKVKKVVVTLDTPIGRFERPNGIPAKTVCPIEILDII